MNKWEKPLSEEVSDAHEMAVLKAALPLIRKNAEIAAHAAEASGSKRWLWFLAPTLALMVLAVVFLPDIAKRTATAPQIVASRMPELEIALEFDLFRDLREIENLDLLRQLGDTEKWVTKKPKPRKT